MSTQNFLTRREKCLEKMASASRSYRLFLIIAKRFDDSRVHEKQLFLLKSKELDSTNHTARISSQRY